MSLKRLGPVVALLLATACGSAGGTPGTSPARSPDSDAGYVLRAVATQAIPPTARFTWLPHAFVGDDGIVVTQGAVPAIFPGPLVAPLFGAPLSDAGYDRIVERARSLGLLDGSGDFSPAEPMPGSVSGTIGLRVDGAIRELTGDPNANIQCITTPCEAAPGTPEAFGSFWMELGDLRSMVGDELGAEAEYRPEAYALLIGVTPPDDAGIEPQVVDWVLDTPLAEMGQPVGPEPTPRCATVGGADAATLDAAFARSNQLTMWIDDSVDAPVSIVVRPLLPGDDPCMELFGVDG
jgi:hypothetical protein